MTRRGYICIILLAAILSLVSACTKVGVRYEPASKEIAVIPVASLASKTVPGPIDGADYPTEETFGIFAYHCNTSAGSWNDPSQTVTPYILDGEFKFREGNVWGGWNAGDKYPYYWPTLGSLVFAGYSPYVRKDGTPVSGASFSVENKTLSISGYQVEEYSPMTEAQMYSGSTQYENKTQSDLMYFLPKADAFGNYVGTNGDDAYGAIFHHALAQVVFNVKADTYDDIDYIRLRRIVLGDILSKGDFVARMGGGTAGIVKWTLSEGATMEDKQVLHNPSGLGGMKLSTEYRQVVQLLTIPVGQHDIDITYTLNVNGSYHEETMTFQDEWESGKKYVYNLILGADFIKLIPDVTEWVEINE